MKNRPCHFIYDEDCRMQKSVRCITDYEACHIWHSKYKNSLERNLEYVGIGAMTITPKNLEE